MTHCACDRIPTSSRCITTCNRLACSTGNGVLRSDSTAAACVGMTERHRSALLSYRAKPRHLLLIDYRDLAGRGSVELAPQSVALPIRLRPIPCASQAGISARNGKRHLSLFCRHVIAPKIVRDSSTTLEMTEKLSRSTS